MVNDKQELIGEYLKFHREKRDISLKVVAHDTKINITQLELLESNQFEKLPNIAYVRGFVKNYSKTLGLSSESCLDLLEKSYYPDKVEEKVEKIHQQKSTPAKKTSTTKMAEKKLKLTPLSIGAFSAVLLIIMYIISASNDDKSNAIPIVKIIKPQTLNLKTELLKPQAESPTIEHELTKSTSKEEKAIIQAPIKTLPKPEIKQIVILPPAVEAKPVEPKKIVKEKEKTITESTLNKPNPSGIELRKEVSFGPLPSPLFTIDQSMDEVKLNQYLPNNIQDAMIPTRQNVYINAVNGDTWITFKVDDNPIKKYILKQGRTLFLKGQLVRIFLGNVHVTKIFYNNEPLKIISRSGVKSLVFPENESSDYVLPLFVYPKSGRVMTSKKYLTLKNSSSTTIQ